MATKNCASALLLHGTLYSVSATYMSLAVRRAAYISTPALL